MVDGAGSSTEELASFSHCMLWFSSIVDVTRYIPNAFDRATYGAVGVELFNRQLLSRAMLEEELGAPLSI